jgi:steroid 5-alpha reductase family enzyme
LSPWVQNGIVIAVPMVLLWLASLRLRDVSIVDIFWGSGFVLVAGWSAYSAGADDTRSLVLVAVVAVWGLRLSAYLAWRNLGKGEDRRYQEIRAARGESFRYSSLVLIFGTQGVMMWVVSTPVQWALIHAPGQMGAMQWLGLVVAASGIAIETTADIQLARFKRDPESRGKVMDRGVWRYSRHPNYFGDFCVWWGLFLLAYSGTDSLITIAGPVLMTVSLLEITGVTLLEKDIGERRPGYAEYVRRTSAFFPWPPKRA